jgi:hypothetical protein
LGSGGGVDSPNNPGGSAVRIESLESVVIDGTVNMLGAGSSYGGGSGGSIYAIANDISGSGTLNANGGLEGGAGRIALTGSTISFNGNIYGNGGAGGSYGAGSGGTVYINASSSISIL